MPYHLPPPLLPAFPGAKIARAKTPVRGGGKLRKRWKDRQGRIYEWDYENGTVEIYNSRGNHLGEFDARTGAAVKVARADRKVEP